MIDYSLALCYGIIVSADKMEEIKDALTDEAHDEMVDNYSRCINNWTGDDYFIGVSHDLTSTGTDAVFYASDLSTPAEDDEWLVKFKQFFKENDLGKFIDWKPELLIIDFCY